MDKSLRQVLFPKWKLYSLSCYTFGRVPNLWRQVEEEWLARGTSFSYAAVCAS